MSAAKRNPDGCFVIRCLITDGTASTSEARWLEHKAAWLREGVELIQVRERDLSARRLARLTRKLLQLPNPHGTRILINDRADVAIACGAHGVHLRDGSVVPEVFAHRALLVSVACHDVSSLKNTRGADFIVLAPIFHPLSKAGSGSPLGLPAITEIVALTSTPILALGGISNSNAHLCIQAGAAGIAGISCFSGLPSESVPPARLPGSVP